MALLDAVKNAPIVDGKISVSVCGTTFTFGEKCNPVTEASREKLLDHIGKACRARQTHTMTWRERDDRSMRLQEALGWWKGNVGKTDLVLRAERMVRSYKEKWNYIFEWNMTRQQIDERQKDMALTEAALNPLGFCLATSNSLLEIAGMRCCVPRAWLNA